MRVDVARVPPIRRHVNDFPTARVGAGRVEPRQSRWGQGVTLRRCLVYRKPLPGGAPSTLYEWAGHVTYGLRGPSILPS